MNSSKVLAAEYTIALAFASWAAIKSKQMPWPPTIVKSSIAFGILAVTSTVSAELAATLGAGFLLAQLMRALEKKPPYTGGAPENQGGGIGMIPTPSAKTGQLHTGILSFGNP